MTVVQPIGVCDASAAAAVAAAVGEGLPGALMLAGAGLAMLAVPPHSAPDRPAQVRLAGRATDAAGAFAPVLAPAQSPEALGDWMTANSAGLAATLRRVAGAVEWLVVVPNPAAPLPSADTGRAYLHALAAERHCKGAVRQRLQGIAETVDPRAHRIAQTRETADLSLLMPREAVAATRAALELAVRGWPGARVCGPFPPYGFCTLQPEETP